MKEKYQDDDLVTYYFVINDDGRNKMIQAWSDDKKMVKFYMEFHNCKRFYMKELTKTFDEITKILDENNNDEIKIFNLTTRSKKHPHRVEYVPVPMTASEFSFIDSECKSYLSSMVNYSFISSALPYIKERYKHDLKMTMLIDIIDSVVHAKHSKLVEEIQFDQLIAFLYLYNQNFD